MALSGPQERLRLDVLKLIDEEMVAGESDRSFVIEDGFRELASPEHQYFASYLASARGSAQHRARLQQIQSFLRRLPFDIRRRETLDRVDHLLRQENEARSSSRKKAVQHHLLRNASTFAFELLNDPNTRFGSFDAVFARVKDDLVYPNTVPLQRLARKIAWILWSGYYGA